MAKYHQSIRTLPVFNFYEILKTGSLDHLWIDEAGEEDLSEVWDKIYNEYCEEAGVDNRHLKQVAKIEELKLKHEKVRLLLMLSVDKAKPVRDKAREYLKNFNFIFREGKPIQEEFDRLVNQLKSLETKIAIEEEKLPKEDKKEAVKLMKQVVALENLFPGRNIDIYTMPVEKWLAIIEHADERIKSMKNGRHR